MSVVQSRNTEFNLNLNRSTSEFWARLRNEQGLVDHLRRLLLEHNKFALKGREGGRYKLYLRSEAFRKLVRGVAERNLRGPVQ